MHAGGALVFSQPQKHQTEDMRFYVTMLCMLLMHTVKSTNDFANIPDHHLRHSNRAPHPNHHGATSPSQVLPHWCDAVLWHWPTTSMSRSSRYLVSPWPECWASPSSCLHLSYLCLSVSVSLSLCNKLNKPFFSTIAQRKHSAQKHQILIPNYRKQSQPRQSIDNSGFPISAQERRSRPLLAYDDESP
jgi:hypothetical protein